MRDPKRIKEILDVLRDVWEHQPDLRLGQIVINAIRPVEPCPQVFHAEDHALLEGLQEYRRRVLGADPGVS
jgi:hypothetical protein